MLRLGNNSNTISGNLFGHARNFIPAAIALVISSTVGLSMIGLAIASAEQETVRTKANAAKKERVSTTENVALAMREIRTIVRNNHSLVTHRRLGVAQSYAMNDQIKKQIELIRASDIGLSLRKALTPILTSIEAGAAAIAVPTRTLSRMDGLFQIDDALHSYGQVVADRDWESLRKQ